MTDKTETNTNENSVAPASQVGRLVSFHNYRLIDIPMCCATCGCFRQIVKDDCSIVFICIDLEHTINPSGLCDNYEEMHKG